MHSFGRGLDGVGPNALVDVKGALYGTTAAGGVYTCNTNPPDRLWNDLQHQYVGRLLSVAQLR